MTALSTTYNPTQLECSRCGHTWYPRTLKVHQCPKCRAFDFNYIRPLHTAKYKRPLTKEIKERILKRDNYTCQRCKAKDKVLIVHHLQYDLFDGQTVPDRALVTLCKPCHSLFHRIQHEKAYRFEYTFLHEYKPSLGQRILNSLNKRFGKQLLSRFMNRLSRTAS